MSKVLVVAEMCSVRDEARYASYRARAIPQLEKWGGKIIAAGAEPIEGVAFSPLVVQEWPSKERYLEWQASDEYRPLLELRKAIAEIRVAFVPLL